MGKTIRISDASHRVAKNKAQQAGMKLASFIEKAIESFDPVISMKPASSPPTKKAG